MKPITKAQRESAEPAHLLLLVPGFPADEQDSTCIPALQEYVRHLARRQPAVRISVISFQYPFRRKVYQWNGLPVYPCGGKGGGGHHRLQTWVRAARYFRQIHTRLKVDIIHSFWLSETAYLGQWLSRTHRIPHVATIMGQDARAENRYLRHLNYRRMRITAPSRFAAEHFLRATSRHVDNLIPIGLDVKIFPQPQPPLRRDIDLLGVGALSPLKDFSTFVWLVEQLAEEFPALRARIIGEGEEHEALQKKIAQAGLDQNLCLCGKLSRPEVLSTMQRSKILVHPSTYESQGYVLMEAFYAGMTVICRPVGYAPPTSLSGRLRRCSGRREMLAELRRLLRQPPDHSPLLLFSIEESVAQFCRLYEECRQ